MCGIVGLLQLTLDRRGPSAREDLGDLLARMNRVQRHRGPDAEGTFLSEGPPYAGLAMRRLSIIDLKTGDQPIVNEDGTCRIVFNGEIYNHRDLRRELEGLGHSFRTQSDTESILHAYEEWGESCVDRLRGMFAFAVWDEPRRRMFLARDAAGVKPLYWTETGDRRLFASEIKSLLRDPAVPRRLNEAALHDYLTFLYVPPPATMFEGVRQLPPGHWMTWDERGVDVREWWPGPAAMVGRGPGAEVSRERAWEVLRESVEAHLISDVPLGAFLSGGLDSTVVVAAMAELNAGPVRTFSIGFKDAGLYDEQVYARQVASTLGTEHREREVEESDLRHLPEIIRHLDEPLADASVLPNYLVAEMARQSVTVALSGAGGDELFGGYRRYYGDAMARRWQAVPRTLRVGVLLPALRRLPVSDSTRLGEINRLAQKFLGPLDLSPERRYLAWNAFFTEEEKSRLYAAGRRNGGDSPAAMLPWFERVGHREFAERAMYVDLKTYLPGDPLFLSDRMTMAHSLEGRVPLVDREVMEFAAAVPLSQKLRGRTTKLLLRQVLEGRVPEEIIYRPKRGFGTPIDLWMKGRLGKLMDNALSPEVLQARGCFDPDYVRWVRSEQDSGRRDFSQHLWALFVLELWHRAYIDRDLSDHEGLTLSDLGLE